MSRAHQTCDTYRMRLIRRGDRGESVLDVQGRLVRLGHAITPDERSGVFGPSTEDAVRAFQQARGVLVDGIVGPDTWLELVDASWRLGDRTLYLRAPYFTGDDVQDLQDRLGTFGFDLGRSDGIFGPRTDRALREFQWNYGLPRDGVAGEQTVGALRGLPAIAGTMPVGMVRERERMRTRSQSLAGMRVVLDPGHGGGDPGNIGPSGAREDELALALASRVEAVLALAGAHVFLTRTGTGPTDSVRAALANDLDAEVYIALHFGGGEPSARGAAAFYFGHERFRSNEGARLADSLLESVCALGFVDARSHAKTFPVLRETRMAAVVLEAGYITNEDEERLLSDPTFRGTLAEAIGDGLRRFAFDPIPAV